MTDYGPLSRKRDLRAQRILDAWLRDALGGNVITYVRDGMVTLSADCLISAIEHATDSDLPDPSPSLEDSL